MITRFNDPFAALDAIQRALDSRLSSDWMGSRTTGTGSFPPINIFQQDDDFVAIIELPGVAKEDLNIQAKQNLIRISGRKAIEYDRGASIHRRERVGGTFDRTITVPVQIEPDRIKAEYRDGVLALFIPRAESEKPRSITIN